MGPKRGTHNVTLVPHYEDVNPPTPKFGKTTDLYLQYFENRHKVKPDLLNVDFTLDTYLTEAEMKDYKNSSENRPRSPKGKSPAYKQPMGKSVSDVFGESDDDADDEPQAVDSDNEDVQSEKGDRPRMVPREEAPAAAPVPEITPEMKRELLVKFSILRKSYPDAQIPEFTEYSDYNKMKQVYDDVVLQIALDSSVINYKKYLILSFMVTELVFTRFFKIDAQGYAEFQMAQMNEYERLLIELGELNTVKREQGHPLYRLVIAMAMNTVLFIVIKMVERMTGGNAMLGSMLVNFLKTSPTAYQNKEDPMTSMMKGMYASNMTGQQMGGGPSAMPQNMRGPELRPEDI